MGRISTFVVAFIPPPPHSLPGFFFFFSFSSGFVCFPSTVPFFSDPLCVCLYIPSHLSAIASKISAAHFHNKKRGKNNNKDDGMRLPPPLSLLLDLFIPPEMK
jgi:hypothetical protein